MRLIFGKKKCSNYFHLHNSAFLLLLLYPIFCFYYLHYLRSSSPEEVDELSGTKLSQDCKKKKRKDVLSNYRALT